MIWLVIASAMPAKVAVAFVVFVAVVAVDVLEADFAATAVKDLVGDFLVVAAAENDLIAATAAAGLRSMLLSEELSCVKSNNATRVELELDAPPLFFLALEVLDIAGGFFLEGVAVLAVVVVDDDDDTAAGFFFLVAEEVGFSLPDPILVPVIAVRLLLVVVDVTQEPEAEAAEGVRALLVGEVTISMTSSSSPPPTFAVVVSIKGGADRFLRENPNDVRSITGC